MKKKAIFITLTLILVPVILLGCGAKTTASPTPNPDLIYTAAAQTADVRLTQIFQSTPSATPVTPSPTFDLTQTAAAQTANAVLTQVANLTLTPKPQASSTPAPTGSSGDKAAFVADVTVPDGTVISPGATFVKTWKLQNAGTTTWTTSYSLVFISGDQMGTVSSVPLSQSVSPGQQVDISVSLVAPTTTGTYTGYWKMKNASGQFFNDSVYVQIKVGSGGPTPTGTQGATPTTTGTPGTIVSNLTMSVDEGSFLGACPHTFTFAASFTLNQSATLTYKLEAESVTPGFVFNLPPPQTSAFGPGSFSLNFPLEFTSSGVGWVRFRITSPVDVTSNKVDFNLTCTP